MADYDSDQPAMSSDEEDTHQCGRCKEVFNSIDSYFAHKKSTRCKRFDVPGFKVEPADAPKEENCTLAKVPSNEPTAMEVMIDHQDYTSSLDSTFSGAVYINSDPTTACEDVHECLETVSPTQSDELEKPKRRQIPRRTSRKNASGKRVVPKKMWANTYGGVSRQDKVIPDDNRPEEPLPKRSKRISNRSKANVEHKRKSKSSEKKLLQCPECTHETYSKEEYDRHLRVVHELTLYVCQGCSRPYKDSHKLKRHQELKDCGKVEILKEDATFKKFQSSNRIYKQWITNEPSLGKNHQDETALSTEHYSIGNEVQQLKVSTHNSAMKGKSIPCEFTCYVCDKIVDSFSAILRHIKQHPGVIPGICKFCGKWFASKYKLWRHITSTVHDDVPDKDVQELKADIYKLEVKWNLPEHMKGTNNQRFACGQCYLMFETRGSYIQHQKSRHRNVQKDNVCEQCSESIPGNQKDFELHMKNAHGVKHTKRFPCGICDSSFKQRSHVSRHRETLHMARRQKPLVSSLDTEESKTVPEDENQNSQGNTFYCVVCCHTSCDLDAYIRHSEDHRVWVADQENGGPFPLDLFSNMDQRRRIRELKRGNEKQNQVLVLDTETTDSEQNTVEERVAIEQNQDSKPVEKDESGQGSLGKTTDEAGEVSSGTTQESSISIENNTYTCPYCNANFYKLEHVYEHKVVHHKLITAFKCIEKTCNKQFQNWNEYEEHSTVHRQNAFICSICNEHVDTLSSLIAHKCTVHRREKSTNFTCKQCKRGFEHEQELIEHIESGSGHFPCTKCDKVLRKSSDLKAHLLLHDNRKPFLCELCGNGFVSKVALRSHVKAIHHGQRPHKCSQCDSSFVKKEHLLRHVISKHSDEKPHKCETCGKMFKRPDKLKDHQRVHGSDKMYACGKCGMTYRYKEGLRYHEKSHERIKKYQCSVCPVNFPRPGQLKKHLLEKHRTLSRDQHLYPCSFCVSTFSRPERVKRHIERVHNISMQWSVFCSVCNKGFPGEKSLNTHMIQLHLQDSSSGKGSSKSSKRQPRITLCKTCHMDVKVCKCHKGQEGSTLVEFETKSADTQQPPSSQSKPYAKVETAPSTDSSEPTLLQSVLQGHSFQMHEIFPSTVHQISKPQNNDNASKDTPSNVTAGVRQTNVFMHLHPPIQPSKGAPEQVTAVPQNPPQVSTSASPPSTASQGTLEEHTSSSGSAFQQLLKLSIPLLSNVPVSGVNTAPANNGVAPQSQDITIQVPIMQPDQQQVHHQQIQILQPHQLPLQNLPLEQCQPQADIQRQQQQTQQFKQSQPQNMFTSSNTKNVILQPAILNPVPTGVNFAQQSLLQRMTLDSLCFAAGTNVPAVGPSATSTSITGATGGQGVSIGSTGGVDLSQNLQTITLPLVSSQGTTRDVPKSDGSSHTILLL